MSHSEEPTYVENLMFEELENVDEVQINVVRAPGQNPERIGSIMVSFFLHHSQYMYIV